MGVTIPFRAIVTLSSDLPRVALCFHRRGAVPSPARLDVALSVVFVALPQPQAYAVGRMAVSGTTDLPRLSGINLIEPPRRHG
jgi:hypothetical protein